MLLLADIFTSKVPSLKMVLSLYFTKKWFAIYDMQIRFMLSALFMKTFLCPCQNGMHSLCPAVWSKHRRWLLMSMLCLNPLACVSCSFL